MIGGVQGGMAHHDPHDLHRIQMGPRGQASTDPYLHLYRTQSRNRQHSLELLSVLPAGRACGGAEPLTQSDRI